jgi:hypothetical protein
MADKVTVLTYDPPENERLVRSRTWFTDYDSMMVKMCQHVTCKRCGAHTAIHPMFGGRKCGECGARDEWTTDGAV